MNRRRRRELARARFDVLVATVICERCGAPICPRCEVEAAVCECCGEFNCERCRAYVLAPVTS